MSTKRILNKEQIDLLHKEYHYYLQNAVKENKLHNPPSLLKFFNMLREKYDSFNSYTDKQLSNQIIAARRVDGEDEWPNISKWRDYTSPLVLSLIEKAKNSCLLAIEIYNKPIVKFRSEGFIVLMMIAWTSLFHSIFLKTGEKIKYKDSDTDYLDLRKCLRKYSGIRKKEIEANLNLLIELRDIIVHRDNPLIDSRIFSYCQACVLNFNAVAYEYFGSRINIANGLAYSLQFSDKYEDEQIEAFKMYQTKNYYELNEFLQTFERKLFSSSPDIYNSQYYAFRVFMVPKPVKERNAEAAIEYIDYDYENEDIKEKVEKVIIAIKETRVGGNYYKAGEVSKKIYENLKDEMPEGWKFSPSVHHARCTRYFNIREGYKTDHPEKTKKEYCLYDPVFGQYIYTQQWIDYLTKQLRKPKIYEKIFKRKKI